MKKQAWKAGFVIAIVIAVTGSAVFAAAAAPAPAKESAPPAGTAAAPPKEPAKPAAPAAPAHKELLWPEFWQTFHHPAPWLNMGLDHRFRVEAGQNWQTLNETVASDHTWLYQRYRTRWWTKWTVNEDVSFNTRLVWEFRTWQDPDTRRQYVNPPMVDNPFVTEFNPDEALFDWFNVNIRNLGGLPLTATLGRQDIMFGVGWLVLDGTPLDGSRTIGAFNAARFTYDWADRNTKVDAIYINEASHSSHLFKPINDENRGITEQDENAGILYLTNTSWKPVQLEGFFIYKNDNPINELRSNFPYLWSRKAEIYTVGAAVAGTQGDHWKYRTEGAVQRGSKYDSTSVLGTVGTKRDLEAYGSLSNVEYLFKDSHENATHVAYEYASGNDPSTSDNEQFDMLWGNWPRWSELFIFTYANETRVGDETNLHRANIGHRFNINKQWQVTGDYHALWADQNTGATNPARLSLSPNRKFRGSLLTSSLRYKFSDQLSGYGLLEYLFPGSYYVAPSDDNAWFFRFNFEYVF